MTSVTSVLGFADLCWAFNPKRVQAEDLTEEARQRDYILLYIDLVASNSSELFLNGGELPES